MGAFGQAPADSGSHTERNYSAQELEPKELKKRASPDPALSVREERRREKNDSDEQYSYRR